MNSIEPKYLEILKTLVGELNITEPPLLASRAYAAIYALVESLRSDLRSNSEIAEHLKLYPEGQLNGVLFHCCEAAFLKTGADRATALQSARECIDKIGGQLSA